MHTFVHHRRREPGEAAASETRGFVWNWGWIYDLVIWFFARLVLGGSEQEFRQMIADLAQFQPGETVLDVGCGTGTLALVAKERVGTTGQVCGIDPGPKQIARARSKAERASLLIDFQVGVIEQLAFPDQSFDVVLSTLVMHHVPDDLSRLGLGSNCLCAQTRGTSARSRYERLRWPLEESHGRSACTPAGSEVLPDGN